MLIVYGIPNCDVVKKSVQWFTKKKIAYKFHNFKTDGIGEAKLLEWINIAGLDVVINKRSTTWRQLPMEKQDAMRDPVQAAKIAKKESSIIKRPIIESDAGLTIGFSEVDYQKKFSSHAR